MILDQAARDVARRRLDANVVVEAGAGTGKTTLLTDRLLFLLLAGGPKGAGRDVTRVVALTFTEKAAGEIKIRLTDKLADLAAAADGRPPADGRRRTVAEGLLKELEDVFRVPPARARERAEKVLRDMDRAPIGTIHHFAAQLLRLHPVEAGVDPSFEIDADGSIFDDLFESEWAHWLDTELGAAPPRAEAWLELLPLAPLEDLAGLARALCREGAAGTTLGVSPEMRESFAAFLDAFDALPRGKPESRGNIREHIDDVSARLRRTLAALDAPAALDPDRPPVDFHKEKASKWPKPWEGLPGRDLYEKGLALASSTSAEAETLVRKAAALLRPFVESFRRLYTRRGAVGYEGLLVKARDLVRDDTAVRRALKARYDAFLIDEFQDTDPLQGEMLFYLAERPAASARGWREVDFAPGKIFVVGDPKQSIYRFRGADARAYEAFTRLILAQGGLKCDLQTNFRAHDGLLGPVNAVFGQAMTYEEGLQPAYLPLHPDPAAERPSLSASLRGQAALSGDVNAAAVACVAAPGRSEGVSSAQAQAIQARWTADWVLTNCGDRKGAFTFKDVAVLFRSSAPLGAFLDAFKAAGIPYAVEIDRYFYGTQEVIDFVNLLRALDDPDDGVALLGLLRSPLAALDDAEVYRLAEAGALRYDRDPPAAAALSPEGAARVLSLFGLLRRFRARVGREPLGDLLARLLRESFLLELGAEAYHGEQTLSNLTKFGRMAAEMGDGRGATLKEFIARVTRSMEESAEEGESPLVDEHLDAVRLLTIHKSKGLEYPVVFLPHASGKRGGGFDAKEAFRQDWSTRRAGLRLPRTKAADLAMALLEREEKEREVREWTRLLYVGMTRAKRQIFLLGQADAEDKSAFTHTLSSAGAWPAKGERPSSLELAGGHTVPVTWLPPPSPEAAGRPLRARIAAARTLSVETLGPLWARRFADRAAHGARPVFDTPTRAHREPDKPVLTVAPSPSLDHAGRLGELCHRVLENWDFSPAGPGASAERVDAAVRRAAAPLKRRHPTLDWDRLTAEAGVMLSAFLVSPVAGELARAEILGREMPFLFPVDGRVIRGSLDLLYRLDGVLWVADYKTSRVEETGLDAAARAFGAQGESYRRVARATLDRPCGFKVIFLRAGAAVTVLPPA